MTVTLVLGGTRSGKSAYAERRATASGRPVRYVATADAADPGMAERIGAHVARRPGAWTTVEAGDALAEAVTSAGACVLLDGLGTWIAGALHRAGGFEDRVALDTARAEILAELDRAVAALAAAPAAIVVAEQAGEGVLPPDAASRAWLDLLGAATQRIAALGGDVVLLVAGRPLVLGDAAPAPPGVDAAPGELARLRHHGDRDVRPGDQDHAVNVIEGGAPPWLRPALHAALDEDAARYPSEAEAIAAVAALHGRDPAEVVLTNGAAEALWLLGPAFRPRRAAVVHPAFTEGEAGLRAHGTAVLRVLRDPDEDFALHPAAIPDDADLVLLGNPASPSGTLDPAARILDLERPGRVVVVDEAFMCLVPGEPGSVARARAQDVVVIRSLTKALGIPGLRVGYALASPPLAERLRAVRPPWSANALALAALTQAAAHPHELEAIARRADAERRDLHARLAALDGVRTWPGAANYVLVEVPDGPRAVAALRDARIAVRPAGTFPGLAAGHLRVTARDPERNARVAAVLERVCR
jgi:histidinol-phosphate/aromatic aminotransferase/cobyric acid decarboxylase-like protein/adenosyl cobinamide kinase/adenosyl cobinamide phosphate guanylyltransferase